MPVGGVTGRALPSPQGLARTGTKLNGIAIHLVTAAHWRDPATYVGRWGQSLFDLRSVPYAGLEDPFVSTDRNHAPPVPTQLLLFSSSSTIVLRIPCMCMYFLVGMTMCTHVPRGPLWLWCSSSSAAAAGVARAQRRLPCHLPQPDPER
jgi:hypothetical protein